MNELGHIRVDNNETRALIVDLADDLDLPVHEILDLAEARGVDPDPIRTDDPKWKRARAAYE